MLNRFYGISIILIVGLAAFGLQRVQIFGADDKPTVSSIAKQEKAIAEEALKILTDPETRGQDNLGDVAKWSRRLVEATRKSGAANADVVAAIEQHVARMDVRLRAVKRLHEATIVTHRDLLNAEYEALEAREWLLDEQQK